jgi:hypothetical protein
MSNEFNKAELNLLKHLPTYRYLSIAFMVVFTIGICFAIYFLLFPQATYEPRHINVIRLNAMVITLGLSCLLFTSIRTIEKIQSRKD